MALADVTKKLSDVTTENVVETQKLNKSNVTLRTQVTDLKSAVQDSAKATKRVEFLEDLLDKNNVGLADTFKDTLAGPLGTLADAIPGKAFLLPFLKLAAQRTPLKGILERRRDAARDKLQTAKATTAIEASGQKFDNEEEKQAAIERLKLEMQKKEQEVQIAEKNKQISDMLGLEIDKFESIVGKTEEVQEQVDEIASSGSGGGAAVAESGGGGGAAMVEEQRDAERASERRHRELIDALKGGGGDAPASTGKGADGPLKGVGGVIKSIGQGFKYLGKNLASIAKGALAMGLMGASLIPFAISAKMFNDVEWESLAKAGASLLGLAGVAFILGKASGSMIVGGLAIAALGGALWVAGKGFQQFAELDWKTIGMGFVAIGGLAVVAAALSFALPFIIPGAVAIAALGAALIPFAYAAGMAAPALTEIAEAFNAFGNVPISTMFAIPAALAAVGAALVAMSAGNFVSGILDGIGKLFGNESPIDKIVRLAESAPNVIALGAAMRSFGDDVDAMMSGLDRLDPAKVDKLDDFSEKIENFVDAMPGVIGTAKIAAFAAAFASIAASAGIAPAVASGVETATGEVIEVQQNPKAYIAKRQTQQTALPTQEQDIPENIQTETGETIVTQKDSTEVPEGKVKVKYKGQTVLVDREDAEKVKAIDEEMIQIAEQREQLREAHDNALPHQKIKKKKIRDADRQLMNKQMQLEKQRKVAIASAVGEDTSGMTTVAEDKQAVVDAMAGGRSTQLQTAQSENAELKSESTGTTNIVAPTTNNITNNQSSGGGGGQVVPIPISEPDGRTRSMIANNF
jgi:hypothetical protein